MPDIIIVYNIVIPLTDGDTGVTHSPEKLDEWLLRTVEIFKGASVVGVNLLGLWYDKDIPKEKNPIEDHNNWYKVGVRREEVNGLREHVKTTASEFGQKCIYFERAGEAEFIYR